MKEKINIKFYLLFLSFSLLALPNILAQSPKITKPEIKLGQEVKWKYFLYALQAPFDTTGENITWDFSKLKEISNLDPFKIEYQKASDDKDSKLYPEAEIIEYSTSSDMKLSRFIKITDKSYLVYGSREEVKGGNGDITTCNKPNLEMIFPFEYTNRFSDTTICDINGKPAEDIRYNTSKYSAYGTLITPKQTFKNAIMVMKYSINKNGTNPDLFIIWLNEKMEYLAGLTSDGGIIFYTQEPDSRDNEPQSLFGLQISPNPVEDLLNVNLSSQVQINYVDISIKDVLGRCVYEQNKVANLKNFSISTQIIEPGLYFLEVKTDSGHISTQKLVKK